MWKDVGDLHTDTIWNIIHLSYWCSKDYIIRTSCTVCIASVTQPLCKIHSVTNPRQRALFLVWCSLSLHHSAHRPCHSSCLPMSSEWPLLAERTSLTRTNISNSLDYCLNATYFAFRNSLCQQVHGTAVNSLVSVVVADLVMEDVESQALSSFSLSHRFENNL